MYMRPAHRYVSPRGGALRRRYRARGGRGPLQGLGDAIASAISPFPASVEDWRDLVSQYSCDLPIDFLMAWIDRESRGNPCSYTTLRESGISQLMIGDNQNVAGTNEASLHPSPPCTPGTQTTAYFSSLTPDQRIAQVVPFIRYVNYVRGVAHQKLDAAGVDWDEDSPDFWRIVKLVFNYPAPIVGWLQNATNALGHPPADWDELRSTITGYGGVLDNAEYVGGFGGGGITAGGSSSKLVLILALGAAAMWFITSRQ